MGKDGMSDLLVGIGVAAATIASLSLMSVAMLWLFLP